MTEAVKNKKNGKPQPPEVVKNISGVVVPEQGKPAKKKSIMGQMLKLFIFGLILLILLVAGVGAGIYFRYIDPIKLAHQLNLQNAPIIGSYIPPVETNFQPVELQPESTPLTKPETPIRPDPIQQMEQQQAIADLAAQKAEAAVKLEEQKQKNLEEGKKRLAKLAKLYADMGADAAKPIINQMDEDMAVAIIAKMDSDSASSLLAVLDPKKAARLTARMARGDVPQVIN